MSENTSSSNIDVSNSFGVPPPRDDGVLELLQFSRNLDIARAQQDAAESQQRAEKEIEYGQLKEKISTHVGHHRLSGDEFVQNVADVVMSRNQEPINAALAPVVEMIRRSNLQLEAKIVQMGNQLEAKIVQMGNQLEAKISQVENRLETRISQVENRLETRISQVENRLETRISQVENRLETRISQVEDRLEEFRDEVRQSAIATSIKISQNRNLLNRALLVRPADTICFFSGEDPIGLGLPPLGTAADIDALSAEEIDRYCEGYRLPRPIFADGQWSGCRTQKESLRSFLYLLNSSDLEQRLRNNRT